MSNKVQVRVADIRDLMFSIHEPTKPIPNPVPDNAFNVEIGARLETLAANQEIAITMRFDIRPKNNSNEAEKLPALLTYEGTIVYHLKGLDLAARMDQESVILPETLAMTLSVNAYSTFRGIIYSKCGASSLRHVYVPIVGTDMIKQLMRAQPVKPSKIEE